MIHLSLQSREAWRQTEAWVTASVWVRHRHVQPMCGFSYSPVTGQGLYLVQTG